MPNWRAPLGPLRCGRHSLPVGDAGLRPELLAAAVQPRTAGRCHSTAPHDFSYLAVTLPICGGQDLASRWPYWSGLQRYLRGEGTLRAAGESAPPDHAVRAGLRAGDATGPALNGPRQVFERYT